MHELRNFWVSNAPIITTLTLILVAALGNMTKQGEKRKLKYDEARASRADLEADYDRKKGELATAQAELQTCKSALVVALLDTDAQQRLDRRDSRLAKMGFEAVAVIEWLEEHPGEARRIQRDIASAQRGRGSELPLIIAPDTD